MNLIINKIKKLIELLDRKSWKGDIYRILEHRIYHVSWTSSSEFYGEIFELLNKLLDENQDLDAEIQSQAKEIIEIIKKV